MFTQNTHDTRQNNAAQSDSEIKDSDNDTSKIDLEEQDNNASEIDSGTEYGTDDHASEIDSGIEYGTDDHASEIDSGIEDSVAEIDPIPESLYKYRKENGRTYHAYPSAQYPLPNDEQEQDRLDLQHHLWHLTYKGKMCRSPIPDRVHRVLDVGTGTGIWAIDFADERRWCKVIAVDLCPIQPRFVPPNLEFQIDNLELPWTFRYSFDFIHWRTGILGMINKRELIAQAFENLFSKGYFETAEIHFPLKWETKPSPFILQWSDLMKNAISRAGYVLEDSKSIMDKQGFINIQEETFEWPMNAGHCRWKKTELAGKSHLAFGQASTNRYLAFSEENMSSFNSLYGMSVGLLTRYCDYSSDSVKVLVANVRNEMMDRKNQATWQIQTTYGQRP